MLRSDQAVKKKLSPARDIYSPCAARRNARHVRMRRMLVRCRRHGGITDNFFRVTVCDETAHFAPFLLD